MAEARGGGERRRVFSAELKLEAGRGMEERRAGGVNLTQIGRELGVRPDQLRKWKRQHDQRAGAAPADVFPGQGRVLVTHDAATLVGHALARLAAGAAMAGVLVAPQSAPPAAVIADLEIIDEVSDAADWAERVVFLPLR
ncbi:MAG TPA: transposase [Longimicrobiaceae bacterium]|jgi:transposase-like protein